MRAVFYARVAELRLLDLIEFYAEDVKSLEALGFDVVRTNSIREAMRAEGDVLYAWWWHSSLPVMLAWKLRGRPIIATGTSHLFEPHTTRRLQWRTRSLLTAVAVRLASVNLAVSEVETVKLRRVRAPRLECLHHAVDTEFFHPEAKETLPTAIVVAQLYRENIRRKGVDSCVLAAGLLAQKLPGFRLILVGPVTPDGARYLEELGAGGEPCIEVVGEVTRIEKQQLLGKAWFYLQPSLYEGFGVAVLEAMACGTVPICSKAGALPEVLGGVGVVLDVTNPDEVAAAVTTLAIDRPRLDQLSLRARERSLSFDSRRHTEGLAEILRRHGIPMPSDR